MTNSGIGTISSDDTSARQHDSKSLVGDEFGSVDADDDTDSLPFLSLAVDRMIHRDDAEDDDLNSASRTNAANDALDSAATAPLPILKPLDGDATAPLPVLDPLDNDTTGPLPVLDALDTDTTGPLPILDVLDFDATGLQSPPDALDSESTSSLRAIEAEKACDNGAAPGLWTKIKAYIGS